MAFGITILVSNMVLPGIIRGNQPSYYFNPDYEQACITCIDPYENPGIKPYCTQAAGNGCYGYLYGQIWACVAGIC